MDQYISITKFSLLDVKNVSNGKYLKQHYIVVANYQTTVSWIPIFPQLNFTSEWAHRNCDVIFNIN